MEKKHSQSEDKGHHIVVRTDSTGAQPPAAFTGLKLRAPKQKSAGVPGILTAVKHATRYVGPVNAAKIMFRLNQHGGIDCPGCAWPDPDDERSRLGEYCENGVKAISEEAQKKKLTADFFATHSVEEMLGWSDFEIGKQGRLTEPMLLREGATHYTPVSWDTAFRLIAEQLNELDSPDEAVFYTSGRTPMRRLSFTNFSSGNSEPTTCPTAPICAMSRAVPGSPKPWASAKDR